MSTLSRLFRQLFGQREGPQLCILCDRPIDRGLRCAQCRHAAQFQQLLESPRFTQEGRAVYRRAPRIFTKEELNELPF